uniref:Uncharacterized protein n=1 Tax=Oryza brachyantha TaxID=4533 RepID=J3L0Q8_ORYBR
MLQNLPVDHEGRGVDSITPASFLAEGLLHYIIVALLIPVVATDLPICQLNCHPQLAK